MKKIVFLFALFISAVTFSQKEIKLDIGFFGINSGKKEAIKDSGIYDVKYTDAALGVAAGLKYVANGGLTIDAYAGVGRNLFGSNSPTLVPRVGVNVGWRF